MTLILVLIIMLLLFYTIQGIQSFKQLLNPVFIFNGVWLICFSFFAMKLSRYYNNHITNEIGIIFIVIVISFNFFFYLGSHLKIRNIKTKSIKIIVSSNKKTYIKKLFNIWLFLTVIEAIYCQGFPLLWLILGINKSYATFGIPSLHGFINSMSWFIGMISFIYYLDAKDKRILKIIIFINIIYVLLLARQSIITEVIQLTVIYGVKRKMPYRKLIYISLGTILIFGVVGSIRTDISHLLLTSGLKLTSVPILLSGFVWIYMYLMTPVANIIYLMSSFKDYMFGIASFSAILPSAIGDLLNLPSIELPNYLISETYNVSSSLYTPYLDFGVIGVLGFIIFMGFYGGKLWKKLHNKSDFDRILCNYSIYIGILALTFFSNMLLSLPIITQFFYINVLFKNYFSMSNKTETNK